MRTWEVTVWGVSPSGGAGEQETSVAHYTGGSLEEALGAYHAEHCRGIESDRAPITRRVMFTEITDVAASANEVGFWC
jgi:hypothetical protein